MLVFRRIHVGAELVGCCPKGFFDVVDHESGIFLNEAVVLAQSAVCSMPKQIGQLCITGGR